MQVEGLRQAWMSHLNLLISTFQEKNKPDHKHAPAVTEFENKGINR